MKRTIIFLTLVFCAVALVFAQGNNRWGPDNFPRGPRNHARGQNLPESATVSGNLTIAQGSIAIVSGETTWLVMGLNRYVGFIDGLKEGAQVTLEGYAMPAGTRDKNVKLLHVQKMTLNGKDYELAQPRQQQQQDEKTRTMQRQRGRR